MLQATTSLGTASVSKAGSTTLNTFSTSPQFTFVTGSTGSPLMLGFVGAGQTQISPLTTAEVLVYYGAYLFTLPEPGRDTATQSLATLPGIQNVQSAVAAAIVARPTENVIADPQVVAAVNALLTAVSTSSAMRLPVAAGLRNVRSFAKGAHPDDLSVNPSNGASGIAIVNDFPGGIHFQNSYRRSAKAFVDEVSHVPLGGGPPVTDRPPDSSGDPIEIESVSKLDGALGTLSNIVAGDLAYTPTNTASMPLSNVAGTQSTLYRVAIVGPGFNAGDYASLTETEQEAQSATANEFYVTSIIIPFFVSVILPNNEEGIDEATAPGVADIYKGLLAAFNANEEFSKAAAAGDTSEVVSLGIKTIADNTALQTLLIDEVLAQFGSLSVTGNAVASNLAVFFKKANATLEIVLGTFDALTAGYSVNHSNQGDLYMITVIAPKISIAPANATIPTFGVLSLTTTVANADTLPEGEALNYVYTCTGKYGHLTDGNSNSSGVMNQDNFTSTDANVIYTSDSSSVGVDTITVTGIEVSGGVTKTTLSTATTTVTVGAQTVTLTPTSQTVIAGNSAPLTAALTTPGSPPPSKITYAWKNTATVGHIVDPVSGTMDTFTTTAATVNYTANANGKGSDKVSVQALETVGTQVDTLASATASVIVQPFTASVSVSPSGCVQFPQAGGSQVFTATASASPPPGTALLYGWDAEESGSFTIPGQNYQVQSSTGGVVPSGLQTTATLNVPQDSYNGFGDYIQVLLFQGPLPNGPFVNVMQADGSPAGVDVTIDQGSITC